jgi:hypothetical protein
MGQMAKWKHPTLAAELLEALNRCVTDSAAGPPSSLRMGCLPDTVEILEPLRTYLPLLDEVIVPVIIALRGWDLHE